MVEAKKENTFIIKWTADSLDWVVDVSQYKKKIMWEVIKGTDPPTFVKSMRNNIIHIEDKNVPFEMYSITIDESVSENEFKEMFMEDPTSAKTLIRDRGRALHLSKTTS